LSTACYVWGIALGALAAGPISETVGRNPIYTLSRLFHLCFILGSALAPNLATQLVCRFLAGLGASIISAIHGASVADVFDANGRSWAWPWVALSSFLGEYLCNFDIRYMRANFMPGTSFSPVVSGWISQGSHISWRWADWISFFMSCAIFIVTFFWLPETFSPILLKWRAKRIRKLTGDDSYLAPIEVQTSFKKRLAHNFRRAFLMTTKEYIVILLGLWLVVVYVVEYGFLEGFNYLFRRTYGLNHGLTGTVFCTIAVGIVLSTLLSTYYALQHKKRAEQWHRNTGGREALPPENRLLPAMLVSLTFPISIFWLGWTNYPSISIWSGLGAATLFGFSWAGIYVAIYSYILDVYGIYAGSALATITCARYGFAGGMSVAAGPLYSNLGTHWACTLLGCIATLLVPIPFVFYKWGPKIRQISRFAGKKELADGAENSPDEENEPV